MFLILTMKLLRKETNMKAVIKDGKIVQITEVHSQADNLRLAIVTSVANRRKTENPNFKYEEFIASHV